MMLAHLVFPGFWGFRRLFSILSQKALESLSQPRSTNVRYKMLAPLPLVLSAKGKGLHNLQMALANKGQVLLEKPRQEL